MHSGPPDARRRFPAFPQVFVTRHMGDYTQRVPAEAFAALQARAAAGELATVPAINGYFDDAGHAADVRQLCRCV